ncbi:uncharacterized protein LOC132296392 [Cornus florida]|uniref:uncharacterized protein LOC132296392 n=1 Tax=Cornus florida TaxID=4283 RepID=UPI00289BB18F|nr:uncharacterized protein LOC132296392 [Cornus florida]
MNGKGQAAVNDMVQKTNLAFSPTGISCPLPRKFKMLTLESFNGTRDPLDDLETYKALIYLQALEEVDDKVALTAFMGGLQTSKFLFSLSKEAPTSMTKFMVRAQKHINAEDVMNARKNKDSEDKRSDKKRPTPNTREERESKYKKFLNTQADRSSRRPVSRGRYNNYTPLNTSIEQVFLQIQDDASLKWPSKLKADPAKRSRDKNCRFHWDHGHNIEDCFNLKNQIKNLVRKGHLRKFTTGNGK